MSNSFKFANALVQTIALQNGKAGPVRQTITNESLHNLQVITNIDMAEPNSPAKAWLRIEPASAVLMMSGATTHFDIYIDVPQTVTEVQTVTFRLAVMDEARPEEDFNRSAEMTFTTQKAVKNVPWIPIAVVVVLVLIVAALGIGFLIANLQSAPSLKLLTPLTAYNAPHIQATVVKYLAEGDEVMVKEQIGRESWFLVKLENETTGWVYATDAQAKRQGDFDQVVEYQPTAISPTNTYVPATATYYNFHTPPPDDTAC